MFGSLTDKTPTKPKFRRRFPVHAKFRMSQLWMDPAARQRVSHVLVVQLMDNVAPPVGSAELLVRTVRVDGKLLMLSFEIMLI